MFYYQIHHFQLHHTENLMKANDQKS